MSSPDGPSGRSPLAVGRRQFWLDRGGTFTDCIGVGPDGVAIVKVLSSDRAPLDGIRALLGLGPDAPIPPCDVRMGTTLATNALLERRGAPTVLIVTRGFGDLLAIGDQTRPDLFDLTIARSDALSVTGARVLEVDLRLAADGRVVESREAMDELLAELTQLRRDGLVSVAVSLLHAHKDGVQEREVGELARQAGFEHVSLSHEVDPEEGYLLRTSTTLVDAYLAPVLADYLDQLGRALPGSRVRLMQSGGSLVAAERFRGRHAILSGPAGGVVAVAEVARRAGFERAIGFDMGGTSTDVCRWDGAVEHAHEASVAGVRVRAPMVAVHTIAAGGGSICRFDGQRMTVGPDSAGAHPGPLCYGDPAARELTLTDVNLVLGRIDPAGFPLPLDAARARAALADIARRRGGGVSVEDVARGFFAIAVAHMAEAIRSITIARGHDPRSYALVAFGGAAGQHACAVARALGVTTIAVHPLAGLMSALGMGLAPIGWSGARDLGGVAVADAPLEAAFGALEAEGDAALAADGVAGPRTSTHRVELRYRGSDASLSIDVARPAEPDLAAAFHARHADELGYARHGHPIEAALARVEVSAHEPVPLLLNLPEARGTVVVDPGFAAEQSADGTLILRTDAVHAAGTSDQGDAPPRPPSADEVPDPVLLEVFHGLFQAIAEQMGRVLRRTALSTNIRERLDFSCAIFDGDGALVANAPHIPVHLGAMGESVRAVCAAFPAMAPGEAFVTNDPAAGGSHLPDITVVSPVHDAAGTRRFFVACRGHHADIGGITPGSMPPFSTTLAEEGVVLPPMRLVADGELCHDALLARLGSGPWPARNPAENLADLGAQVAANRAGISLLLGACERHGLSRVERYMAHIQDHAAAAVTAAFERVLPTGTRRFADALDDGTPIAVAITRHGARIAIDFSGTAAEVAGNLNAPRAVTMAAILYVIRTLVRQPIPLNGGCLRHIDIHIPEASLLAPSAGRAVVAGNVETSQRVVDVLLGALGIAAASQGTMNNLTFGDATFGYYETLGGGAGAGPDWHGQSAVHTHMTNTRITDPEVLESRFPVRLWQFSRRRGSGGTGRWRGGDGLVRELELLRPMTVSLLTERRVRAPWGVAGGGAGAIGLNTLDGHELGGKARVEAGAGARLRLETPGGGGWGAAARDEGDGRDEA